MKATLPIQEGPAFRTEIASERDGYALEPDCTGGDALRSDTRTIPGGPGSLNTIAARVKTKGPAPG